MCVNVHVVGGGCPFLCGGRYTTHSQGSWRLRGGEMFCSMSVLSMADGDMMSSSTHPTVMAGAAVLAEMVLPHADITSTSPT